MSGLKMRGLRGFNMAIYGRFNAIYCVLPTGTVNTVEC
jgi:hypothetical protein